MLQKQGEIVSIMIAVSDIDITTAYITELDLEIDRVKRIDSTENQPTRSTDLTKSIDSNRSKINQTTPFLPKLLIGLPVFISAPHNFSPKVDMESILSTDLSSGSHNDWTIDSSRLCRSFRLCGNRVD